MKFQFNSRRTTRLFTTRHSTSRAILISVIVFAASVAMGYIGTAANPDIARRVSRRIDTILGNPPVSAKDLRPEFGEVVASHLTVQDPLPPLTTDKTGYLFNETVNINGYGFLPGETVTLQVKHADGSAESGAGHDAFTASAQPDGTVSATWNLSQDSSGNDFIASALGSTSGISASTAFSRIAMVRTDKFDYLQGETVRIHGRGFAPNETVTVQISFVNGKAAGAAYGPLSATSDGNGELNTSWLVDPAALDSILLLTATGSSSGLKAQTIFTDVIITVVDDGGADDLPGQKDLNQLSTDNGGLSNSIGVSWNWDDTAWSGNNTGDACSLFDTDGDGFANFSLCVTVGGTPAAYQSTRLYTCGDARSDRCTQPDLVETTFSSECTAAISANSDPFAGIPSHTTGNTCSATSGCYTDDTVAVCTVELADVGASNARLLNVCSYPSQEPNSNPNECVITPNNGFLTIKKTTQTNDSTATEFAFNTSPASQTGVSNFSKSITGQQTDVVVAQMVSFAPTNSLSITEVVPSGWDLTNATCAVQTNVPQSTGTFNGTTAITGVAIQSGLETICTFTDAAFNVTRGKIIVDKVTDPGGDTTSFDFTSSYGSPFSLTAADTPNDSGFLTPGNYSVAETANSAYVTTSTCTSNLGHPADNPSSINLAAGEIVTCTFTNTKKGKIIVEKQTNPNGAAGNFTFTGDAAGTISDNGTIEVANLAPGTYSSIESDPTPGFDLTSISCDDGASATPSTFNVGTRTATFKVDPGETVKCTFTNTQRGKIIVEKQTNPNGAAGNFTFTGDAAGTISDNGTIEVPNLVPGTYYSTEADPTPGFDLTSISCDDSGSTNPSSGSVGTRKATFKVDPGETVKCTFTNTQRGMVVVNKTTNGGVATMPMFNFSLTGPDVPGGPNVTTNDVNDTNGVIDFGGRKLLPNVTYTVCELVPAGYTSFWRADIDGNGTAEIITPYNPNASDIPPQDLGVRCYNFTVDPGETLTFLIDNSRPGGDPRTIGYWKNWNRCTGGGQAANAEKNGGPAFGFFVLEDLLPQLIGDFNVTTCLQGVKILGKQDQSGKSKSSDAAYELAAQLLAAKLNLAAGAETCQAVADAVIAAQNLLDSINFTGSGAYLDSKVKGPAATQRTQALSLANTLDRYNNGNLCP